MKRIAFAVALLSTFAAGAAVAQEHFTEGPVWEVWCARTAEGHGEDYIEYLRKNYLPTMEEQKKQGLVQDVKFFLHVPAGPDDADICIATLHKSFGAALDYSADFEAKAKAIAAKHYKTEDEDQQEQMSAPRFQMRRDLGTTYFREIQLKPMP